jgi:hypothetical protein
MYCTPEDGKNALGQELKVGDVIAYPVRGSSSMWLSYAVVDHVEVKQGLYGRNYTAVSVFGVGREYSGKPTGEYYRRTVTSNERILTLHPDTWNDMLKELHETWLKLPTTISPGVQAFMSS